MGLELIKLTLDNTNEEIYQMLQEIGPGENGFINGFYINDRDEFNKKIKRNYEISLGINLEEHYVPQTIFWVTFNGNPIGYAKLRHKLNENLYKRGGHIGYVIRPSSRKMGYGKLLLQELLKEAKHLNIEKVLLTVDEDNIASRKIIEWNNGELTQEDNGIIKYWIKTS